MKNYIESIFDKIALNQQPLKNSLIAIYLSALLFTSITLYITEDKPSFVAIFPSFITISFTSIFMAGIFYAGIFIRTYILHLILKNDLNKLSFKNLMLYMALTSSVSIVIFTSLNQIYPLYIETQNIWPRNSYVTILSISHLFSLNEHSNLLAQTLSPLSPIILSWFILDAWFLRYITNIKMSKSFTVLVLLSIVIAFVGELIFTLFLFTIF